ncbi:Uncharacterised protein [Klebsiella pneumoniae]|nr:Uncharacterised protein [Klebsiella pneumoniae]VGF63475.1 Uncharacterised protein [Klebsiella pneumoniae]
MISFIPNIKLNLYWEVIICGSINFNSIVYYFNQMEFRLQDIFFWSF